jgi:GntR family transcriptional regulator, transcriptional repressor for pyruvate dehydrogenase complex
MPDQTRRRQAPTSSAPRSLTNELGALPQRTRAEQLAALLDERIRNGEYAHGESVGTLESLRAETGFAYATVSEAVRLLRDRGLLEIRQGRGGGLFAVEAGPVVRMRHTLLGVTDNPTTVADAVELREHLELLIDVAAARHRTDGDVRELEELLTAMERAQTDEEFLRANWALHERIAVICPNEMARSVYIGTLGHMATTAPRIDDRNARRYRRERLRIHRNLVEAIASGAVEQVRNVVDDHNGPE